MPSPREAPGLWDTVVIGKVTLPPAGVRGHVSVEITSKIKDDSKAPKGTQKGRTTLQGMDLAEGEIDLEYPDEPGFQDLVEDAIGKIWPPKTAESITHGKCLLHNIRDVTLRSLKGPDWKDGKAHLKIAFREWSAPSLVVGSGSSSGVPSSLAAEIAAVEAELKKTPTGTPAEVFNKQTALINKLVALKKKEESFKNATKTPDASNPGKQWSKGGAPPAGAPSIPLGEIQP